MKLVLNLQSSDKKEAIYIRERPLMMSNLRGDEESEMTPKNWTLEGKNRKLGGEWGVKNW